MEHLETIHLEYVLNTSSRQNLWAIISTPVGLEGWFADKVTSRGKVYNFFWEGEEARNAIITGKRLQSFIKFKWESDSRENIDNTYFELRISQSELTNQCILSITEVLAKEEAKDQIELWKTEVETMRRVYGF